MKIKKRYQVLIGIIVVLVLAVLGVKYFYLNGLVRQIALRQIEAVGYQGQLDGVSVGIFSGSANLRGLRLSNPDGQPLLRAGSAGVNLDFWKAIGGDIQVQRTNIRDAEVQIRVKPDGSLDLGPLLAQADAGAAEQAPPAEDEKPMTLAIGSIFLRDTKISIEDNRPDTPIKNADLTVGQLSLDLNAGTISVEDTELSTSSEQPFLKFDSIETEGNIHFPFEGPLKLESVSAQNLTAKNKLMASGKPLLQEWLLGLVEDSGLLAEAEESETGEEAEAFEIPKRVTLRNIQTELSYPNGQGGQWQENIKVDSLNLENGGEQISFKGLAWSNELSDQPVIAAQSLDLSGQLFSPGKVLEKLIVERPELRLAKNAPGDLEIQNRVNRILGLILGEEETPESSIEIAGPVEVNGLRLNLDVKEEDGAVTKNQLEAGVINLDFKQGNYLLEDIKLSDAAGSFEQPALSIPSARASGKISVPPTGRQHLESVIVENPVLNVVKQRDGNVDLLLRLRNALPGGGEEAGQGAETPESDLQFQVDRLEVKNLEARVTDQLPGGMSVTYRTESAELVAEDLVYPTGQGQGWMAIDLDAPLTAPSSGKLEIKEARVHHQGLKKGLDGNLKFHLDTITSLSPYYEKVLPLKINSGQLQFDITKGSVQDSQLNVPYKFQLIKPDLEPGKAAGLDPFQGMKNTTANSLIENLKNDQGDVVYEHTITGNLDSPEFHNFGFLDVFQGAWQGMAGSVTGSLGDLIGDLPGAFSDTAEKLKDSAGKLGEGVGGVGRKVLDTVPFFGSRKEESE